MGLIRAGVQDIIRIGGRADPALFSFNLKNIQKKSLDSRGHWIKKEVLPETEEKIAAIDQNLKGIEAGYKTTLF